MHKMLSSHARVPFCIYKCVHVERLLQTQDKRADTDRDANEQIQTDRQTGRQTERPTDGQTDRHTDRRTDGRTDGVDMLIHIYTSMRTRASGRLYAIHVQRSLYFF